MNVSTKISEIVQKHLPANVGLTVDQIRNAAQAIGAFFVEADDQSDFAVEMRLRHNLGAASMFVHLGLDGVYVSAQDNWVYYTSEVKPGDRQVSYTPCFGPAGSVVGKLLVAELGFETQYSPEFADGDFAVYIPAPGWVRIYGWTEVDVPMMLASEMRPLVHQFIIDLAPTVEALGLDARS